MLRTWEFQIQIDLTEDKAIYLQIADSIIKAIKEGKLKTGEILPGSRKLAEQIKVNRNTVVKALDVLMIEGWLETAARKGVFVADLIQQNQSINIKTPREIVHTLHQPIATAKIIFDDGLPDSRLAPVQEIARAYRKIFNRKGKWRMMGYGGPQGDIGFRNSMVQMLNHKRGMSLDLENICITKGSQMALYLVANCLVKTGDLVAVENPGYKPAWEAFERAGANLIPIPVEHDGMDLKKLKTLLEAGKRIKALYTTPHHHYPTTVSLSLQKRMELIELSNKYGFTLVEDDYDHEFHFSSRPLLPIGSLNTIQNYAYIGTLSKIVSPALRVGYVATHAQLMNQILELRRIIDVQGDTIMEQALLELINEGDIKRHLHRATKIYQKKRDLFDRIVCDQMGDRVLYTRPEGGLAFWLQPKGNVDVFKIANQLEKKGVKILTPDSFSFFEPVHGMRLGYASLSEEQMEEGIMAISKLL